MKYRIFAAFALMLLAASAMAVSKKEAFFNQDVRMLEGLMKSIGTIK